MSVLPDSVTFPGAAEFRNVGSDMMVFECGKCVTVSQIHVDVEPMHKQVYFGRQLVLVYVIVLGVGSCLLVALADTATIKLPH